MGLFGKRKSGPSAGEKALAKAIAKRGVPAVATIVDLVSTGAVRAGGVGKEIEFTLQLELPAGTR